MESGRTGRSAVERDRMLVIDPVQESGQGSTVTGLIPRKNGSQLPVPALFAACEQAGMRFVEFFTANIRNPNTRGAYYNAACRFATWCEAHGLGDLRRTQPVHVAAYVEEMQRSQSRPSVKQHLAAIRMLMDWLVVGQVIPWNPAAAVRGPRHQVKKGKAPVLSVTVRRRRSSRFCRRMCWSGFGPKAGPLARRRQMWKSFYRPVTSRISICCSGSMEH